MYVLGVESRHPPLHKQLASRRATTPLPLYDILLSSIKQTRIQNPPLLGCIDERPYVLLIPLHPGRYIVDALPQLPASSQIVLVLTILIPELTFRIDKRNGHDRCRQQDPGQVAGDIAYCRDGRQADVGDYQPYLLAQDIILTLIQVPAG